MSRSDTRSTFEAPLLRAAKPSDGAPLTFVLVPKAASAKLPRRGRTTVDGTLAGAPFRATLEPDGQLSHWLPIDPALLAATGREVGDTVTFEIASVEAEPEPAVPEDLARALAASPDALAVWHSNPNCYRPRWVKQVSSDKASPPTHCVNLVSRNRGSPDRFESCIPCRNK